MSDLVLLHNTELKLALEKWKNDDRMTQILKHANHVQDEVNRGIRAWKHPATSAVSQVLEWILSIRQSAEPTPYDYRRHARAIAAELLFKAADPYTTPLSLISSTVLQDRWSRGDKINYFRTVAICSGVWEETDASHPK